MTLLPDAAWLDAMLDADRHDEALEQLDTALAAAPDNARLYALRGDLRAGAWHHREAAADWETALSLAPGLDDIRLKLALLEITRPYRLAADADDDTGPDADGDDAWRDDEEDNTEPLQRMLEAALATRPLAAAEDPTAPEADEDWPGEDGDDDDYFEFRNEDTIRAQGLLRLQALADEGRLDRAGLLQAVAALTEGVWLPWHALDLLQRGLAAHPASADLLGARAALWMGLATDTGDTGEDVPAGYSADLTGNLYHPISAATALNHCATLPEASWNAELYERRAQLHRLLGDHAAAAEDFNRAARYVESLAAAGVADTDDDPAENARRLREEAVISHGGDSALITARQQQMRETLTRLAELRQSLSAGEDREASASLDDAREAAIDYIETIAHDPLDDADYLDEVRAQMPEVAEAVLDTLEDAPYDFRPVSERELAGLVGEETARIYAAERDGFIRLGFAAIGWMELPVLSRRLGQPAVLDVLLSPDHTTIGLCFVMDGAPTRELHSLATGGSLSHATVRGRSAGWAPSPFRQVHLPPETPLELVLRLHEGAVRQHRAQTGDPAVTLQPSQLPGLLEELRRQRHDARVAQGFHDAEIRGYSREHYRAGGQALREALAARMASLRPRTH